MELITTINAECELGEGIVYDDSSDALLWTDIEGKCLHIYEIESGSYSAQTLPWRLGSFGLSERGGVVIAAFEQGIAFYDWRNDDVCWVQQVEEDLAYTRFNDGRVDRAGQFCAGTMVEDEGARDLLDGPKGALYRVGFDGQVTPLLSDLHIPNSLCWSPNGERMYHCDSPARMIMQYRYQANGTLSAADCFATTEEGCFPDGSCVDADGYVWNAQWGGSQIVRYSPDGAVDLVHKMPVSQPSCVCFAGSALDILAVTTARQSLSEQDLAQQPQAGNVFLYRTPYRGLPENRCMIAVPFPER